MSLRRLTTALALSAVLTFSAALAFAQGIITGTLGGSIVDPSGAVVPNAQIEATAAATGVSMKAASNSKGEFSIPALTVGTYKLTITSPGFDTLTVGNVVVTAGGVASVGVEKLKLGSAMEDVEVSTAQNMLETVQSQVTTTFDSVQVANLPTGGGFDELALLIPGDVSVHGNNRSNTNGASISSNGQRGRNNNFEIDGQSNNDNSVAGPQAFFSNQDALQEVQVITDNFGAQYGRDAGSVVNYITKSGTNSIHGTGFYSYEGSWLSSLTQGQKGPQFGYCAPGQSPATTGCVTPKVPRFDDNVYGGSLGGPILKDKLFAFGSALLSRNVSGQTIATSGTIGGVTGYTPTVAGIAALVGAFPGNPAVQALQAYGPYAVNYNGGSVQPIANSTYNALISNGTTSTTVPVSLYSRTVSPLSTDEEVLGRLDYQATSRDRFFARYFYQNAPSTPYNVAASGGIVNLTDNIHSVGSDWTHTFGPRLVNQLRYSFQQSKLLFAGGAFPNCTTSNFVSCPTSVGVSTAYAQTATSLSTGASKNITPIASFGLSTSYPQGRVVKDTQIQDNLTLTLGKHSITMGGSYEFQNSPNVFLPNISGGFTFFGGNGLLQDAGQVGLAIGNPAIHFTEPDVAAYFQDDWRVTPDLTVNLGLRWEFFSSSINLLHNISLANQTGPTPLWNTALPQSETVFPYIPQDYKHFEPRLGFAYNPSGMKSLVIRGGYAINISPAFYNIFLNSYGSAPVVLASTVTGCNNTTKLCLPGGGANYTSVHALDNQYLPTGGSPGAFNQTLVGKNFKEPITQTYSLGIQQQIGRIAVFEARYVGAHTSGDFQSVNSNPAIGFALNAFPSYFPTGTAACTTTTALGYNGGNGRLDCNNGNIRSRTNTSFEVYNGLQTSIVTKNYKGLTANFGYTWSRTIDNASEIFSTDGSGATIAFSQNPLNTNVGERGVSGNSYPNVTSLGLVYVAPFFKEKHGILGKLLYGFQLNTIYLFNSGQPYTPYQTYASTGSQANFCDYSFDSSFAGGSTCRPILANPNAPIGNVGYNAATTNANHSAITSGVTYVDVATGNTVARNSEHWIYNNYAEALTIGNPYGGVGRNTVRGGSYNNADASIFKNNKITERVNMQLQVTAFNVLNRAFYGAPDAYVGDAGSTFGNYTGNAGSNRNVQVGARVIF